MSLKIFDKLQQRKEQNAFRTLSDTSDLVDFVSNDYLGLSRSKDLNQLISRTVDSKLNGSTGSRLLAGNHTATTDLEKRLASIFRAEAALIFNSGYVANLALISTIPQRGDTIIYDSLSHVCLKEGAWLSKAQSYSFKHNDTEDLEKKLNQSSGDKFVIIESIYSMDGDTADFAKIISTCKRHDAYLIVDEAHSTGLYGGLGEGMVCNFDIEEEFLARVYTFGKAMGVHGAVITGSRDLIDSLINFGRSFIYTTALPPHSITAIDQTFRYLESNISLQEISRKKISLFNQLYEDKIGNREDCKKLESYSPIQPIIIPGNDRAKHIAQGIQEAGYDVRPILSPTVPEGSERLRISIHVHNTDQEIEGLIDTLTSLL